MRCALTVALLLSSAAAFAQAPGGESAPPAADIAPTPPAITDLGDPNAQRRRALYDLAFAALVRGDLPLAEQAFTEAQALPGDPVQSAVAGSFVERVQHLRARRRTELDVEAQVPRAPAPESGYTERIALLGATTSLGLGLYGWTLPNVLGIDPTQSTKGFVGVYLITASASFFAPYLIIGDQPVSAAQTNLAFYGGTRGIWAGVLMTSLIAGDVSPDRRSRAWNAGMLGGSLAGLIGGYQVARAADMSAGDARTIAAMGDFGLLFGFGTGFLLRLDGGPRSTSVEPCRPPFGGACPLPEDTAADDRHARAMSAAGLVGLGVGLAGGTMLAHRRDNTWGDGEVLRGATAIGAYTGLGIGAAINLDLALTNRALMATMMVGGTLGAAVGDRLVRHTDFTPGQAVLIDLSMIAGGLLGAGVADLATKSRDARPYLAASAGGAVVGFGLGYWKFRGAAEGRAARQLSALTRHGVTLAPLAGPQGERGLSLAGAF